MPVSAEGRVEHQKLNQTAALLSFGWVFGVQLDSLEKKWLVKNIKPWRGWRNLWMTPLVNRAEHQKLNQTTAELSFGWVFGVQLGLRQTQALIETTTIRISSWTPKTQPKDSSAVVWLSFWCSTRLLMSVKKCASYLGKLCIVTFLTSNLYHRSIVIMIVIIKG